MLHAWRESGRNSVQAWDSLSMRESWKPCRSWRKKCNFQTQFVQLQGFCQHFTENPFFISNEILTTIMSIPPSFHYSFMIRYWIPSCLFLPPFLFWWICPNYYKSLTIEKREREREREREGGEREREREREREGGGREREREREKGCLRGGCPLRSLKKCKFQTQFQQFGVYYICQHFTENPLFISNKIGY